MKTPKGLVFGLSLLLMLSVPACGNTSDGQTNNSGTDDIKIVLSDAGVTVNGKAASDDKDAAVYVGGEIIYYHDQDTYESGNAYGAGDDADKHTEEEAAKHTLVTITEAGTYTFRIGASSRDIRATVSLALKEYTEKTSTALAPQQKLRLLTQ